MTDLLIIGAGPAGLTAALYATRAGADVIIVDSGAPGGKLNVTADIENYPGITQKGPELAMSMYEHCLSFGAKYEYAQIESVKKVEDHFEVKSADKTYEATYVMIATGTKERKMEIPLEEDMIGRGVSYCAVCDGPFFRGKEVAVVGGGNSAIEEAIYLASLAQTVHVIVRRDVLRADQYLVDKAKAKDNIQFHFLRKPVSVLVENDMVSGLELEDSQSGEKENLSVNGIFPFIGLDPVSDMFKDLGILDNEGYIPVDENQQTQVEGLFAGGDVTVKNLRQVVTATNDGAIVGQYVAGLRK